MVVGSAAFFLDGGDSVDMMAAGNNAAMANKCRYKTGKCMNQRSSKRNGQAHMLCLYHRDKANKIQRKFDRQKRQSARMSKSSPSSSSASPSNRSSTGSRASMGIAGGAASAFAHSIATATARSSSSFTGLLKQEMDTHSDSESGRFSTDSESSVASHLDQVWRDVPNVSVLVGLTSPTAHSNLPSPVATRFHSTMSGSHGQLSHDEIDFLYAAMLE